jgi:uncharacterized SAM-binding protein YcdF (DUF218 family)
MSFDVLIILLLCGLVLYLFALRRTARTVLVVTAVLFVLVGCGVIPLFLLKHWQAPYAMRPTIHWKSRNAIVLLGAGTVRTPNGHIEPTLFGNGRIQQALVLYRECKANGNDCKVEVSGGDAWRTGKSEADVYAALLEKMGMPATDLLREPNSMNTWQNAQFSATLLGRYQPERVVLVSSATHLTRGSLYFAHFGIATTPVRADWLKARLAWWPSSWNFAVTDVVLHEYIGVWRYHFYNFMGWNVKATKPGAL